jgi:hypothetical protein
VTVQFSTAVRDAENAGIISTIGGAAQLRIYTGTRPAACSSPATGTLLSQHALGTPYAPASSAGSISPTLPANVNASNSGVAGYWRVYDNAGAVCHQQGDCGTAGTEMVLNTTSLVAGGPVQIAGWTINQAAA